MDSNQFGFLVNKLCRLEHSLAEITNIKTRLDAIEGQRTGPQWPRPYSEVTRSNIVRSLLPAPPAREPGPIPRVQPPLPAPPALGPVPAPRVRPPDAIPRGSPAAGSDANPGRPREAGNRARRYCSNR